MSDIEFIVVIGGNTVVLKVADLKCVRVGSETGKQLLIMPGTIARCLALGASAVLSEQETRQPHEIAKDCALPPKVLSEKAEAL